MAKINSSHIQTMVNGISLFKVKYIFMVLQTEEQPQCVAYQTLYTVKTFLIEYGDLALMIKLFSFLNTIFENIDV